VHKQEIALSISAQLNKDIFKNLNLIQSNSEMTRHLTAMVHGTYFFSISHAS